MASAETLSILNVIGHDIVRSFVSASAETFLIAIYSVLVLKASRILLRKERTKVKMLTLAAVVTMYILALILWIIDLVNFVAEARITLIDNSNDDFDTKYSIATSFIFRRAAIQAMLYSYMSIIGDAVIVWRVYAFWSTERERVVLLIPGALLLASIITSIMLTVCVAHLGSEIEIGTFQKPAFCRNIQTATYCIAVATTLAATILIGIKSWRYRYTTKSLLSWQGGTTKVERVMILLIESGMLYCLFFLVQLLMSISSLNKRIDAKAGSTFALTMFVYMTSEIVGIYPTLIIILVHSNKTMINPTTISSNMASTRIVNLRPGGADNSTGVWGSSTQGTRTELEFELQNVETSNSKNAQQTKVWKEVEVHHVV
ncbi:hypothetical protein BT96DRAFT_856720 [Gymnopus androsaceus JB14]|uniref:G-protein coupled receptors family 1 profile domain-containing protein n=1 Tax=Gymnopus androsaceus JB14 TaxID=1447944 RepID=A0A6A4HW30_9AGAR|nr:hypothetical protein BT96DRAFT_856720 [Gymnopus androsaceus JB14]